MTCASSRQELRAAEESLPGFRYVPALSEPAPEDAWDGETGLVTDMVKRHDGNLKGPDAPVCEPPQMVETAIVMTLVRDRRHGRPLAHHNPMLRWRAERSGRYRPRVAQRIPQQIPDEKFGELFAALGWHRDRALVSLWVSSGTRASEPLGVTCADADPGQQLITVIRKGSRVILREVVAEPLRPGQPTGQPARGERTSWMRAATIVLPCVSCAESFAVLPSLAPASGSRRAQIVTFSRPQAPVAGLPGHRGGGG